MISINKPLILAVLALGLVSSRTLRADEHPVTLEKNVDAAKCLECHEDKSKGKNVHSAIAMGCTTCHEVKTEGETTKIELNQPADQLCFTCHANEAKAEDSKHGPWEKGRCVLCHDPHVSDFPKQLRAEGNTLCLECHGPRENVGEKVKLFNAHEITRGEFNEAPKKRLSADGEHGHPLGNHPVAGVPDMTRPGQSMSCLSCHVPHTSPGESLARIVGEGKQAQNACDACHSAMDNATQKAQAAKMGAAAKEEPAPAGSDKQETTKAGGTSDKPQTEKSSAQGAEKQ